MKQTVRTKKLILCAMFTTLIVAGTFIKVPLPFLPFTMQFFFTMLAAMLLGGRWGMLSVLLYMVLGLIGLPVFTEGGGIWYIFKPSFGYIIGYVIGTYVTGKLVEMRDDCKLWRLALSNLAGVIIVYVTGMIYYYIICNFVIDTPISVMNVFIYCCLLIIPKDLMLCVVTALIAKRLKPVFNRIISY